MANGNLETEDPERDAEIKEIYEIRRREQRIILENDRKRTELTEKFLAIPNPTKEDRQKFTTEIRNLEVVRLAMGSPQERLQLFKLDVPDFAKKNAEATHKDETVAMVVEQGKQLTHKILETMKGAMYKQKQFKLDVWERNKHSKRRRSVMNTRHQSSAITNKLKAIRKLQPREYNAGSKQNKAGKDGDVQPVAGGPIPDTAPF